MDRYRITPGQELDPEGPAFGARIEDHAVVLPDHLTTLLARHALGDDAVANASFLASFPSAVAQPLGLSPQAVLESAQTLLKLLKDAGAEIPTAPAPQRRIYGAMPPQRLAAEQGEG